MLYVCLDKNTKEPKGCACISDKFKIGWQKKFDLIVAGEEYKSKNSYEIKYEGGRIRLATQEENDTYHAEQTQQANVRKKIDALATLGITQEHLDKLKSLPTEVSL